jgi:transposase
MIPVAAGVRIWIASGHTGRLKVTSAALPRQRPSTTICRHCGRVVQSLGNGSAAYLAKLKLAEAIRYATSRRKVLEYFLIDGRVEIDSNIVERGIQNVLFVGSDGRTWATIATLLQTAKMNEVDPLAWLARALQRIAEGWPISQIEKLCRGTTRSERPQLRA